MKDVEVVQIIQNYIQTHYKDDNFNANCVCSKVGYSRRQVDRLFKKHLNKTLQEYITAVRLTEGANELLNTKKSILEVALNSHYETHEGFSRSFHKRFHIIPSAYRE
nr:helix-turn-helix transcriptional regulator [uncultured Blautia sp.]